jgi:hypothetical protein
MRPFVGIAMMALLTGCATSGASGYRPTRAEAGELTLRYDDGFQMWNGPQLVSSGPRYEGLAKFVRCAPKAKDHAETAESWGLTSTVLSSLSIGLAVGGLGGLAGLYFDSKDDKVMAAFLLSGLALEVGAIVLGGTSIAARTQAHGNALDAMNYYNDAVGASGETCR